MECKWGVQGEPGESFSCLSILLNQRLEMSVCLEEDG